MCSVPFASLSSFWIGSEKSIASGAKALIAEARYGPTKSRALIQNMSFSATCKAGENAPSCPISRCSYIARTIMFCIRARL